MSYLGKVKDRNTEKDWAKMVVCGTQTAGPVAPSEVYSESRRVLNGELTDLIGVLKDRLLCVLIIGNGLQCKRVKGSD